MSEDQFPQDSANDDLSQAEAIAIVQQTIQQLDGVLEQLNRPKALIPSKTTLDILVNSAIALSQNLAIPASPINPPPLPISTVKSDDLTDAPTGLDQMLPDLDRLDNWWDRILVGIRNFLPRSLSESLSDWALTSILAGILVTALISSVFLLPRTPQELAEAPPLVDLPSVAPSPEPEPEIIGNQIGRAHV